MKRAMRRFGFAGRAKARAALTWVDVSQQWSLAVAATSLTPLIMLQAPASLANLTADPPEDLTVLRIVGDFTLNLVTLNANWTLGLIVADVTWTPGATFTVDADKRVLWHKTFENTTATSPTRWYPPEMVEVSLAAGVFAFARNPSTHVDITPKVRIEPGKALYLVAWENVAGSIVTSSQDMRVLFKRSGRKA